MSQAEFYNKVRRIVFSTFHRGKEVLEKAFEYLEGYKISLVFPLILFAFVGVFTNK